MQFVDTIYLSVRVPFSALAPLASNVEAAAARCIPHDTEALSVLRAASAANLPDRIADPRLGRLSAMHFYDLIALAIGATGEAHEIASQRGLGVGRESVGYADQGQALHFG